MTTFDQEIMARTAMGEARGEGIEGMTAVMWVGLNRFTSRKWYSSLTIAGTFLMKNQFTCWTPGDPNYPYITNITDDIGLFRAALDMAGQVIAGLIPDPTGGATSYCNLAVCHPDWVDKAEKTVTLGKHTFFRNEP